MVVWRSVLLAVGSILQYVLILWCRLRRCRRGCRVAGVARRPIRCESSWTGCRSASMQLHAGFCSLQSAVHRNARPSLIVDWIAEFVRPSCVSAFPSAESSRTSTRILVRPNRCVSRCCNIWITLRTWWWALTKCLGEVGDDCPTVYI